MTPVPDRNDGKPRTSKQRYNARKRAERTAALNKLRDAGASCATCHHFDKSPFPVSTRSTHVCGYHSDGGGWQLTAPGFLCLDYAETPPHIAPPEDTA